MIHESTEHASKNLPISNSESPYNAYYLRGCSVVARSPSYASCLAKIGQLNQGFPMSYCEECNVAIRKGDCDAVGMRQQETLAGVALFFQPSQSYRNKQITNLTPEEELPVSLTDNRHVKPYISSDPRAANCEGRHSDYIPKFKGQTAATQENAKRPNPTRSGDTSSAAIEVDGYAAAINAAMRELDNAPPVTKPAPPPPVTKPAAPTVRPAMMENESPLQYARRIAALRQQLQTV